MTRFQKVFSLWALPVILQLEIVSQELASNLSSSILHGARLPSVSSTSSLVRVIFSNSYRVEYGGIWESKIESVCIAFSPSVLESIFFLDSLVVGGFDKFGIYGK